MTPVNSIRAGLLLLFVLAVVVLPSACARPRAKSTSLIIDAENINGVTITEPAIGKRELQVEDYRSAVDAVFLLFQLGVYSDPKKIKAAFIDILTVVEPHLEERGLGFLAKRLSRVAAVNTSSEIMEAVAAILVAIADSITVVADVLVAVALFTEAEE